MALISKIVFSKNVLIIISIITIEVSIQLKSLLLLVDLSSFFVLKLRLFYFWLAYYDCSINLFVFSSCFLSYLFFFHYIFFSIIYFCLLSIVIFSLLFSINLYIIFLGEVREEKYFYYYIQTVKTFWKNVTTLSVFFLPRCYFFLFYFYTSYSTFYWCIKPQK